MDTNRIERRIFLLSALVLVFFYGVAVPYFDLFPNAYVRGAIQEADHVFSPPDFVVPRVHDRVGSRTLAPEKVYPGLTLIAKHWQEFGWRPGLKLIDQHGRTLHAWRVDPEEIFSDSALGPAAGTTRRFTERALHGVYLFENGDVIINIDYVGAARLDACGRILWTSPERGHHSVDRAEDATFWIPGVSRETKFGTPARPEGLPGIDRPVYHDRILRMSESGRVLESINVFDLLYANDLQRHLVKTRRLEFNDDLTHLNDVEVLRRGIADDYPLFEAGDLLVSLHGLDLVLVFDPETKEVKWHASHPFIEQHDPDFTGGGWIGVFDNNKDGTRRGTMLGGSRIVALQPHTDSIEVLFPTSRSEPFYTDEMGKWQRLSNGNLLLTESRAGRIVEVSPDGQTVWEWVGQPYAEGQVSEISEGSRYELTVEEVVVWPCSQADSTGAIVGSDR